MEKNKYDSKYEPMEKFGYNWWFYNESIRVPDEDMEKMNYLHYKE
jgi:hypothetical protein